MRYQIMQTDEGLYSVWDSESKAWSDVNLLDHDAECWAARRNRRELRLVVDNTNVEFVMLTPARGKLSLVVDNDRKVA